MLIWWTITNLILFIRLKRVTEETARVVQFYTG